MIVVERSDTAWRVNFEQADGAFRIEIRRDDARGQLRSSYVYDVDGQEVAFDATKDEKLRVARFVVKNPVEELTPPSPSGVVETPKLVLPSEVDGVAFAVVKTVARIRLLRGARSEATMVRLGGGIQVISTSRFVEFRIPIRTPQ